MSKHIDFMEPIFFTPPNQSARPVGGRRLFKGGGGGGGQRAATKEEKRLWAAQAQSLEGMSEVAMPNLVTGMNNLGEMANESMDGSLHARLRDMASTDAMQSGSMGLAAAGRGLERFGATVNPNALAAQKNMAGLEMAKTRAGGMNMANMAAEDVKWQRNAALTGLASGQGNSAVSGMGQLAGQIGQSRQSADAISSQQNAAAMQGLGGLGAMIGTKMFADGGSVKKEVRLADGGNPGMQRFQRVEAPTFSPMKFRDSKVSEGGISTADAITAVGTPIVANFAANKIAGLAKPALDSAWAGLTGATGGGLGAAGAGAAIGTGAELGFGGLLAGAGASGAAAGAGAAAGTAAAGTAAAAGAAGTVAATNFWNPAGWAAAAYLAGSALDLWADGGPVPKDGRKDMTPGGDVHGPGTETSDSIPARLSHGEFVENAEAVKMPRATTRQIVADWVKSGGTTKELLERINDAGLERRNAKGKRRPAPAENGEAHAANGGFLTNLGLAARGFVPVAMEMDRQKKMDARMEKQDARLDAQDVRTQTLFDRQIGAMDREDAERKAVSEEFRAFAEGAGRAAQDVAAVESGRMTKGQFVAKNADLYNQGVQDGRYIYTLADGSRVIADNAAGKNARPISDDEGFALMNSPQAVRLASQQLASRLAAINPKYADMAMRTIQSGYERQEKLVDTKDERGFQTERDDKRYAFESGQNDKKLEHDLGMTRMKIGAEDRRHAGTMELGMAKINAETGGMGGKKVMDSLAKYDGWLKNALKMGETQMTSYDDKQRARAQAIYSNGMKIAQRQLEQGKMPDVDSLIRQATDLADGVGFSAVDVTNGRKDAEPGKPDGAAKASATPPKDRAAAEPQPPKRGLIAGLRDTFNDETGTATIAMRNARARALLPGIQAKMRSGLPLTEEERAIASAVPSNAGAAGMARVPALQ